MNLQIFWIWYYFQENDGSKGVESNGLYPLCYWWWIFGAKSLINNSLCLYQSYIRYFRNNYGSGKTLLLSYSLHKRQHSPQRKQWKTWQKYCVALADSLALKKNKKEPHEPLVTPMSKSYLLPAKKVWQSGNVTVVFDGGYLTHSTKENIHLRESNEKQRRSIVPALANSLAVKKNELFMNKHNKQEFPLMLRSQVYDLWISVYNANRDADFIAVTNALAQAKDYPVTVKIQSSLLLKKFCSFLWLLTKKKKHWMSYKIANILTIYLG